MFLELAVLDYNEAKIDSIAAASRAASKKSYFYASLEAKLPM